jgi:hypothetical protein
MSNSSLLQLSSIRMRIHKSLDPDLDSQVIESGSKKDPDSNPDPQQNFRGQIFSSVFKIEI